MTSRWSAMIHAQDHDLDTFRTEIDRIGEHLQKGMESSDWDSVPGRFSRDCADLSVRAVVVPVAMFAEAVAPG